MASTQCRKIMKNHILLLIREDTSVLSIAFQSAHELLKSVYDITSTLLIPDILRENEYCSCYLRFVVCVDGGRSIHTLSVCCGPCMMKISPLKYSLAFQAQVRRQQTYMHHSITQNAHIRHTHDWFNFILLHDDKFHDCRSIVSLCTTRLSCKLCENKMQNRRRKNEHSRMLWIGIF